MGPLSFLVILSHRLAATATHVRMLYVDNGVHICYVAVNMSKVHLPLLLVM